MVQLFSADIRRKSPQSKKFNVLGNSSEAINWAISVFGIQAKPIRISCHVVRLVAALGKAALCHWVLM
jgi:hypothetical protein